MSPVPRWIRCGLSVALVAITLPLSAAGRDVGPRSIAPTAYQARLTDVAYTDDRYLAVWVEQMGAIGEVVRGSLLDGTGQRISESSFPILTTREPFSWMELVAVDGAFVLFSRELRGEMAMTNLDRDGNVTGRIVIATPTRYSPVVAWNGSRFLLASGSTASFLNRDGEVVVASIPLPAFAVLAASRGDGFLVLTNSGDLSVVLIGADGSASTTLLDEAARSGRLGPHPYSPVVTTLPDGRAIVLWAFGNQQFFNSEVRSAIVSADGTVSTKRVAMSPSTNGVAYPMDLVPKPDGAMLILRIGGEWTTVMISADGVAVSTPQTLANAFLLAAADNGSSALALVAPPSPYYMHRVDANRIASDGTIADPELLARMPARQTQPAIAWGGDRLFSAWTDQEGDAAYVRSAAVTAEGEPISHQTVAPGFLAAQALAWNGSAYLVVHYDNGRLRATRVGADGQPVGASIILDEVPDGPHWSSRRPVLVVWAGTHWLVMWPGAESWRMARVSISGDAVQPRNFIYPAEQNATPLALAFDGTHAMVVIGDWTFDPLTGRSLGETTATLLSPDGELIGEPLVLPSEDVTDYAAVATSGAEFVVVARSKAMIVRRSGTFLSTGEVRELRGEGDVTWDGRDYVAVHRRDAWQWTLELQRFDPALNPIGGPRFVRTLPPDFVARPSVAARADVPALVAIQEGDADGARAVVYREDAFEPLPPLPPAPVNVRKSASADSLFEITWEAPRSGTVDAYVVEILGPDGSVYRQEFLSPDVRRFAAYYIPPSIRVRSSNANGLSELPIRRRGVGR